MDTSQILYARIYQPGITFAYRVDFVVHEKQPEPLMHGLRLRLLYDFDVADFDDSKPEDEAFICPRPDDIPTTLLNGAWRLVSTRPEDDGGFSALYEEVC